MRRTIGFGVVAVAALAMATSSVASAKRRVKLVNVKLVKTIKPQLGFIDDPLVFDGAGGRLLYVNADTASLAQLRVIDLTQGGAQLNTIDISKFTTTPERVHFVFGDQGYFVVTKPDAAGLRRAAVFNATGKLERTFGPATDVRLTRYVGKDVVVLFSQVAKRNKGKAQMTHYTVELRNLKTGKRSGRANTLVADSTGAVKKLDFRIAYWLHDYTMVVGVKGGTWDRKEDQRSPDVEAWYDIPSRTFSKRTEITNPMAHVRAMSLLGKHSNESMFLFVERNLSGVSRMNAGVRTKVTLAEPFHHYQPKTLVSRRVPGGVLFTLTIDPVHPDAAARRRAVPKYLDLYYLADGSAKATRKARVLLRGNRGFKWIASQTHWILIPRHVGFDRGGKELRIFAIK